MEQNRKAAITVRDLVIGYDGVPLMRDLNFDVRHGEIFGILGGSGCGKSTLLKHLIGLFEPISGDILIGDRSLVSATPEQKRELMRRFGVTYQGGALFGSMTVAQNIALPLEEYTDLTPEEIAAEVREKLALVDLAGTEAYLPAELSGGMRKRAGLARALALKPDLLFFDEPSAGLDPISAAALDRLILTVREHTGATVVIVTHELESIFSVIDRVVLMDKKAETIVASGDPRDLRDHSSDEFVRSFLNRDGMKGK